jgi:Flp pilus assembly protein TadG
VEFALVVPLFVMLVVGLLEFGRAYNVQLSIQGAAREGARALALGQPSATVEQAVKAAAPAVSIDTVVQTACPTAGGTATVTVTKKVTFSIPFVSLGTRNLSAQAAMRCGL